MSSFVRDVVFAVRLFVKRPGFAAVAIVTLALGIGANSAIFSVINGVLWNAVPFPDPEELVYMGEHSEQIPNMSVSYPNFRDWRERNRSFEAIAAHNFTTFNLTGVEVPEVLRAARVSASLFPILRVSPILGRAFTEKEDQVGGPRVALVSHQLWRSRLGGDPDVVGRTLTLDGEPYEIIGVMPRGFLYPVSSFEIDLWMPIGRFAEQWIEARGSHPGIYVTGRLEDGVTLEGARSDMATVARALAEEYPDTNTGHGVSFSPLVDRLVANIRPALLVLAGAVALVLLIACANVANLLLARGMGRKREIALRSAIGCSRWQLVRQLLTESVVLAVIAGAAGIGVAAGAVALLESSLGPSLLPGRGDIRLDATVLVFTLALSVATGLFFGLFPAFGLLRRDLTRSLKDGDRGSSRGQGRLKGLLVVSEVALALVLLTGATLFIQSFRRLTEADAGFDWKNVLTLRVNLSERSYPDEEQQARFYEELLERVRALPGVVEAATTMPLLGGWQTTFLAEGQEPPAPGDEVSVDITRVSPGYFRTMGVELLGGRVFTERDRNDSRPVAIVDETFAEAFWPGQDPLGKRVKIGTDPGSENPWMAIVGVVGHVKHYGVAQPSRIEIYLPSRQSQFPFATLVVKTGTDPRALLEPVTREVLAIDPDQPVARVRTLEEILATATTPQRVAAELLGVFSGLSLVLAAIGIYGVMAYTVAEQRHEIGIRMALGAKSSEVLSMVVLQGLKLAAAGVVGGLTLAFVAAPLVSSQLFGIDARDPSTFLTLPAALAVVALAACAIPALRAARVSPVTVLRYE